MEFGVKAETRDVILRVLRADRLRDPDGHQILRLHESGSQPHRAFEFAVVVFGLPGLAAGLRRVEV